jgi:S-disulfanyl-L-cysteine oxidoreductase SoxD
MERIGTVAAAGILTLVMAAAFPSRAQSAGMQAGVYTAAQATAGARLYAAQCSACHGSGLRGDVGPALIGDAFTSQWTGEAASDPYNMMTKNMPQTAPGSLKPAEYLDIMAFILQKNKFPAGSAPLTAARLQEITLHAPPNPAPVAGK